jgi:hypothetical protein
MIAIASIAINDNLSNRSSGGYYNYSMVCRATIMIIDVSLRTTTKTLVSMAIMKAIIE